MGWPIDPKNGFLRAPNPYVHDAFGHDGAVDGCARVRPHSGIDSTPRVPDCPALSVLGGRVVRTGWTIYAGHFVVVDAPDGWLWLDIHLAARTVSKGDVLREGGMFGIVGNTGGGGSGPLAGKQGKLAIHLHTSRCKDMAAVDRIVNGLVRARRKGETAAQWAAAHGLSDPYPHIIASVKALAEKPTAPTAPLPIPEDDMTKTKLYRRAAGEVALINPDAGLLWHVPSPAYLKLVEAVKDELGLESMTQTQLDDVRFRMLCQITMQGHDPAVQAQFIARVSPKA